MKSFFNLFKSTWWMLTIVLLLVYLVINVVVLLWYLFEPEGFWGIVFFYSAFIAGLTIFVQLLTLAFAGISAIWEKKFDWRLAVLAIVALAVVSVVEFGPTLWFHKRLANRYRYIKQSEKYMAQGRFEKALENAEKYYHNKDINNQSIHPFFFMRYWYEESAKGQHAKKLAKYQALVNKAWCIQRLGNLDEAISLYESARQIAENDLNESEEFRIIPLLGLMQLYYAKDDILKAEEYYYSFQKLNQDIFNSSDIDHSVYAYYIYAYKSKQEGNYEKMAELYEEALFLMNNYYQEINTEEHFITALVVCNSYIMENKMDAADSLLTEIKDVADEYDDNESYLSYLNLLTTYFSKTKDIDQLEKILNDKEKFVRKRMGNKHAYYLKVLSDINAFYLQEKNYDQALDYAEQVSEKMAKIKISKSSDLYNELSIVSGLTYYYSNKLDSALSLFGRVENNIKEKMAKNFYFLTPKERESTVFNSQSSVNVINGIYAEMDEHLTNKRIYDNLLFSKGLALESINMMKRKLAEYGRQDILTELDEIKILREKIQMEVVSGNVDEQSQLQLTDSIQQIERTLLLKIGEIPGMKTESISQVDWDIVRNSLQEKEYAVEYMFLPGNDLNEPDRYYALVLGYDYESPKLIKLPFTPKVKEEISTHVAAMSKNYSQNISMLKDCFLEPINKITGDSATYYLSLSGPLHSVSFSAISIDEPCNIHIVNSTRLIANKEEAEKHKISNTVLFGGIAYGNINPAERKENTLEVEVARSGYHYLSNTKTEVDSIKQILETNHITAFVHSGEEADESTFRNLSGSGTEIIHIATHGFYYPFEQSYRVSNLIFQESTQNNYFDNPMLRSGLLFSGVNESVRSDRRNDGILTAFDISQLDFSSTELVVLSACETGIGEDRGFEGVFGLQRSFQMAGANKLLVSLWKVPDQQTMDLMTDFYSNYLNGLSLNNALKTAQLKLKENYPEPYYWAGFKLVE